MKKLMQKIVLSCRTATELIEKKNYINLKFSEKIQLKIHKMICKACDNFDKQSTLMENVLKHQIKYEKIDIDNLIVEIKKKVDTN